MKSVLVPYDGFEVSFTEDGWFNATLAAEKFGKRPIDWIRLQETQAYLIALSEGLGISEPKSLIRAKRNSGTWLHPKLAVRFAQWLDVKFAVWCDMQIDSLIRGEHDHFDWKRARHEASSSFKVMNAILQMKRDGDGKVTKSHHYSNEARLINWALTGEFKSVDRGALSNTDLDLLAKLEEQNAVLLGGGLDYKARKQVLDSFAVQQRALLGSKPDLRLVSSL